MQQTWSISDYIASSGSLRTVIEHVDHLHEHFIEPGTMRNGHHSTARTASRLVVIQMKAQSLRRSPNCPAAWLSAAIALPAGF